MIGLPFKAWVAGSNPAALTINSLAFQWFPEYPGVQAVSSKFHCAQNCAHPSQKWRLEPATTSLPRNLLLWFPKEPVRQLSLMKWGLVPHWAKRE